jgi:hypothetical protein
MKPYLSVVAVSRNDDHGGDPLIRTQIFIDTLALQCESLKLPTEILIVDWNPVVGRPGLSEVLEVPPGLKYVSTRVIVVPCALHHAFKSADKLHLFQMIGKNVGIRRAKGDFILATNIDVLFSAELVLFLAQKKLKTNKVYRVDRFDIKSGVKKGDSVDQVLEYAWSNPIRENSRFQPHELTSLYKGDEQTFNRYINLENSDIESIKNFQIINEDGVWQIAPEAGVGMELLHTNACGDFTLMSKEGWETIGGYAEFEGYSFNIDSLGLIAAHYSGFEEITLLPPLVCFHIEHSVGSGWTPEGEAKLFQRMQENGITSPEWPALLAVVNQMKIQGKDFAFNDENWGLINFDLPECEFGRLDSLAPEKLEKINQQLKKYRVGAIKSEFELDRIMFLHERKEREKFKSDYPWIFSPRNEQHMAQLYISDKSGEFSELRSLSRPISKNFDGHVSYSIKDYKKSYKLRFDPMNFQGIAHIKSLMVLSNEKNLIEFTADQSRLYSCLKPINDIHLLKSSIGLIILATGCDPQFEIEVKKITNTELLTLVFEMRFPEVIE